MKKQLCFIFILVVMLSICVTVFADTDWNAPCTTLTSSEGITCFDSWMLNQVVYMNESPDGWYEMQTEADGNVSLTVLLDPEWNDSFNMEIVVDDAPFFTWRVPCNGQPEQLLLGFMDAGTTIRWRDCDLQTGSTQANRYLLLVGAPQKTSTTVNVDMPSIPDVMEEKTIESTTTPVQGNIINESLKVGDRFVMGYYEQDGNLNNGREPVEWIVLDVNKKDNTALVIASEALECIQYHIKASGKVKWGSCSLRMWMNYCFFFDAFNEYERECVETMNVAGVVDHVTLLDENQVKAYNLVKTGCDVTTYARNRGAEIGTDNGKGCWWVRMNTTGSGSMTKFIGIHGKVYEKNKVTVKNNAVRPAMTVSISALQECPQLTDYQDRPMWNLAYTNQKIATRSGPSTSFDEIRTFNLPVGTPVNVLRIQTTKGTPWVEIEFLYEGEWVRVWTGKKRIDKASTGGLQGDYEVFGNGVIIKETSGLYGPGYEYRTLYSDVEAGTNVEILYEENGWYLVQYKAPKGKLIMRTWVPQTCVAQ